MALVFLLLLTILGIAALNTTSLEEKMAHNVKDRNLAFQAAESALIVAENWIYTQIGKPVFPNKPHRAVCARDFRHRRRPKLERLDVVHH